ncbi:hypothetical protein [Streptomyces aurantiogriseus]|uniref:Uncharacterized protein n=1 Tax=Streptomyces aurantiogriseus TaxID=66870 RepID=A0A918CPU5_9ACTN|nr:hypothetical protein [Streptomyces aurantiogriseus]GGR32250.1 hypothetical protein GCM10010251_55440 [Streptomyces aurantiogriseus]
MTTSKFVDHELKADEGRIGPHDHLTRAEVLALLPTSPSWPSRDSKADRDRGHMRLLNAAKILDWLADHPGDGWQERWRAAGADSGKAFVLAAVLGDSASQRNGLVAGLNCLMMSRIVLPGYAFLRGYKALRLFKDVQQTFPGGVREVSLGHLRAPLRNPLQARACLHPLPGPPDGSSPTAPPPGDHPEPPRAHSRGPRQRLARRGRRTSSQL